MTVVAKAGLGKIMGLGSNPSGSPSFGGGDGGGGGGYSWRTADLKTVCELSPQIALARYFKIPFAPFVQSITATFVNTTDNIGPFALGVNANDRLSIVSVVDQVIFHVDSPALNAGNAAKGFLDWWFARQTGIQATLIVDGSPRYLVAPDPTPIDTLADMMTEMWPQGWVLNYTQAPKMQFNTTFALPAVPTTVTVTFRMWQPVQVRRLIGLTDASAVDQLVQCGVLSAAEGEQFCT
jgi:hypothetical protein